MAEGRTTVVIATRNRAPQLQRTLQRLQRLPEAPPVIVVDNGSSDGTAELARAAAPAATVLRLPRNAAAAARTIGVRTATTPYVAFSDDDSWWAPGALSRAEIHLDRHPELGLLAACLLVGPHDRPDPVLDALRHSPLRAPAHLPGPAVLGFIACAAVVRRRAYLAAGGFHPRLGVGGEEALLALDLARSGWALAYADDVVAHHWPAPGGRSDRDRRLARNRCWTAWLRRPAGAALRVTATEARRGLTEPAARQGLASALRGLGWVLSSRLPAPPRLERDLRALERAAALPATP